MAKLDKIIDEAKELRGKLGVIQARNIPECYAGINFMDLHPDKNYADVGVSVGNMEKGKTFAGPQEYWDAVCAVLEDRRTTPGEKAKALFSFDVALQFSDPKYAVAGTPQNRVREQVHKIFVELVATSGKPNPVIYAAQAVSDMNRRALEEIVFLDLDRVHKLYEFLKTSLYRKKELRMLTLDHLRYVGADVAAG